MEDGDKVTLCPYNYDKGRTKPHNPGMRKSKSYRLIPTPEQLATRFLGEVVAATAGTQGFAEQSDALRGYLETLQPHRHMDDYRRSGAMPQPWPLQFSLTDTRCTPSSAHGFGRRGSTPT
jgi:hypothetical protein